MNRLNIRNVALAREGANRISAPGALSRTTMRRQALPEPAASAVFTALPFNRSAIRQALAENNAAENGSRPMPSAFAPPAARLRALHIEAGGGA